MDYFKKIADAKQFAPDKMKKNVVFGTDHFLCDVYCFEPGQSQPPHTHDGQDKVYYVVEGEGNFQVGDEERTVGAGEVVLAPSGQEHGVSNETQERLVTLVFVTPKPSHAKL